MSMGRQSFIKIYQKVQGIGPVSLFSEFEPRQNLDLSQISFDSLIGYILSISMCMQNFIIIFFIVLEIGSFSLFQNLELGKASTDKKCQFAISWARSCQYKCLRKSLSKSLRKCLRIRSVISLNYHYITVLFPFNLLIRFKCYNAE